MGSHIFGISGIRKILVSRDLKRGRFAVEKLVPAVVLIFNSRLALNSVLEITMTFAQK